MTQLLVSLNTLAGKLAGLLLAPVAVLPGWLSATLVAATTGVFMLVIFKYTSHQRAIKRVRNRIKANLLALSLFKDSVLVSMQAHGRILVNACHLMLLAIVPMLVMTMPMCLLLGQLALWYQARPLRVGEEAVLTMHLTGDSQEPLPEAQLQPSPAVELATGPVRVCDQRMICWSIHATQEGYHQLTFQVAGQQVGKELAVGDRFMQVSLCRPGWNWSEMLMHPRETPFAPASVVQSIEIDYPRRVAWTSGSDYWLIYWFVASMVAASCIRPLLRVNV